MEHSSPAGVQVQQSHDKLESFQAAEGEIESFGDFFFFFFQMCTSLESSTADQVAFQLRQAPLCRVTLGLNNRVTENKASSSVSWIQVTRLPGIAHKIIDG